MIGTAREAAVAHEKFHLGTRPRGWRKIGVGASRVVYLAPSGVAYKVNLPDKYWPNHANESEFEAFKRFGKWKSLSSKGIFFPEASLYRVDGKNILAAEYIKKTHSTYCGRFDMEPRRCTCEALTLPVRMCYADLANWLERKGMNDMHYNNVYRRDDRLYVIDLGYN